MDIHQEENFFLLSCDYNTSSFYKHGTLDRRYNERQYNERSIQWAERSPLSPHLSASLRLFTFDPMVKYIVLRMTRNGRVRGGGVPSCRRCMKPFGSRAARYIDDLLHVMRQQKFKQFIWILANQRIHLKQKNMIPEKFLDDAFCLLIF